MINEINRQREWESDHFLLVRILLHSGLNSEGAAGPAGGEESISMDLSPAICYKNQGTLETSIAEDD
jgi:hypothetical protein